MIGKGKAFAFSTGVISIAVIVMAVAGYRERIRLHWDIHVLRTSRGNERDAAERRVTALGAKAVPALLAGLRTTLEAEVEFKITKCDEQESEGSAIETRTDFTGTGAVFFKIIRQLGKPGLAAVLTELGSENDSCAQLVLGFVYDFDHDLNECLERGSIELFLEGLQQKGEESTEVRRAAAEALRRIKAVPKN
jgi:hypothetical protein